MRPRLALPGDAELIAYDFPGPIAVSESRSNRGCAIRVVKDFDGDAEAPSLELDADDFGAKLFAGEQRGLLGGGTERRDQDNADNQEL
ncbi:MAG: hypothetical protein AAFS02_11500 [Pseudomonadota bacterium]